jgi:hypothetical protein
MHSLNERCACCCCCCLALLQVVERAPGDAWASEFGASSSAAAAASNWSSEFMQQQGQQQQQQPAAPRDWAAEFADGFANINIGEGATEEQLEAAWAAMGECTAVCFRCHKLWQLLSTDLDSSTAKQLMQHALA